MRALALKALKWTYSRLVMASVYLNKKGFTMSSDVLAKLARDVAYWKLKLEEK